MRKLIFIGAIGCGKTSLTQKLQGQKMDYDKTQQVEFHAEFIDTPGEFVLHRQYVQALNVTAAEAKGVALVQSVKEQEQIFSPGFTTLFSQEVIGIISKCDGDYTQKEVDFVKKMLQQAGVQKIFVTSAKEGLGLKELRAYIDEKERRI